MSNYVKFIYIAQKLKEKRLTMTKIGLRNQPRERFVNNTIDFCRYISYNSIVATKGGDIISEKKKMGRPTDSPKDTMFRVRLDEETENKLEQSAEQLKISKSDVVRKGIKLVHDTLQKK